MAQFNAGTANANVWNPVKLDVAATPTTQTALESTALGVSEIWVSGLHIGQSLRFVYEYPRDGDTPLRFAYNVAFAELDRVHQRADKTWYRMTLARTYTDFDPAALQKSLTTGQAVQGTGPKDGLEVPQGVSRKELTVLTQSQLLKKAQTTVPGPANPVQAQQITTLANQVHNQEAALNRLRDFANTDLHTPTLVQDQLDEAGFAIDAAKQKLEALNQIPPERRDQSWDAEVASAQKSIEEASKHLSVADDYRNWATNPETSGKPWTPRVRIPAKTAPPTKAHVATTAPATPQPLAPPPPVPATTAAPVPVVSQSRNLGVPGTIPYQDLTGRPLTAERSDNASTTAAVRMIGSGKEYATVAVDGKEYKLPINVAINDLNQLPRGLGTVSVLRKEYDPATKTTMYWYVAGGNNGDPNQDVIFQNRANPDVLRSIDQQVNQEFKLRADAERAAAQFQATQEQRRSRTEVNTDGLVHQMRE